MKIVCDVFRPIFSPTTNSVHSSHAWCLLRFLNIYLYTHFQKVHVIHSSCSTQNADFYSCCAIFTRLRLTKEGYVIDSLCVRKRFLRSTGRTSAVINQTHVNESATSRPAWAEKSMGTNKIFCLSKYNLNSKNNKILEVKLSWPLVYHIFLYTYILWVCKISCWYHNNKTDDWDSWGCCKVWYSSMKPWMGRITNQEVQ